MALVKFGGGIVGMSGKIAGTVFARGPGGNVAHALTKPVNPRSALQQARRSKVAFFTHEWSTTLTELQRTDWRAYASGTTWHNRLGEVITINGLAAFLGVNALNSLFNSTLITAAPLALGHAAGITMTFTAEPTSGNIKLNEPSSGWDKSTDDDNWVLYQYAPVEPGRIAMPKGAKFLSSVQGNSGAPQSFPLTKTSLYTMQEGQRITVASMHLDPQKRISVRTFAQVIATDP